jgi:hypothetical protein
LLDNSKKLNNKAKEWKKKYNKQIVKHLQSNTGVIYDRKLKAKKKYLKLWCKECQKLTPIKNVMTDGAFRLVCNHLRGLVLTEPVKKRVRACPYD